MCFHGGSDNSDSEEYVSPKQAIKDAIKVAKDNLKASAKRWQRVISGHSKSLKGLQRDFAKSK